MKKQIWLLVVKISAVILWVFTLFIPDIYLNIHGEETYVVKEVETQDSTKKAFEIEFSEDVIYGHIDFIFYDENDERVYAMSNFFDKKYSKNVRAEFEDEDLAKSVRFKTEFPYAKTVNERNVDIISAVLASVMLVVVILVLRIDLEEKVVDGKTVKVYSGILKHQVKVDGEIVFKKNWFALFKERESVFAVSETQDIKVAFGAMNKISVETISNQKIESEVLEKDEKSEKQQAVEKVKTQRKKTQKKTVDKKSV